MHPTLRLLPTCLILSFLALAGAPATSADPASPAPRSEWAERLDDAVEALHQAAERLEAAEDAYQRARVDQYPRGEALEEIEKERRQARLAHERARERLPALVEQARRDGVLPGTLRPYRAEIEAYPQ